MRRVPIAEWLDTDAGSVEEIAASLGDLGRINRWFGGIGTTQSMVERVAERCGTRSFSMLEVASGTGVVPYAVQQNVARRGIELDITLLDRASSHLKNGGNGSPKRVAGDARTLPFADNSFDLVSSCIFVHHLSPEDVLEFVQEGLRVCRRAVLINDLMRHAAHLALVYAGLPLFRSRITRHDAPASVRQAYTAEEMRRLLHQTEAREVEVHSHYLYRMGVIAWK
jgi:ubiquinone/menaquinone biosynthesis C-methylase UbiE